MDITSLVHTNGLPTHLLEALTYAVFRPLSKNQDFEANLSAKLLLGVERDLRHMSCRRPQWVVFFADTAPFMVALGLSIVLAIGDVTDTTTPFPLSLGLLLSWLPLLSFFSFKDHCPTCPGTW